MGQAISRALSVEAAMAVAMMAAAIEASASDHATYAAGRVSMPAGVGPNEGPGEAPALCFVGRSDGSTGACKRRGCAAAAGSDSVSVSRAPGAIVCRLTPRRLPLTMVMVRSPGSINDTRRGGVDAFTPERRHAGEQDLSIARIGDQRAAIDRYVDAAGREQQRDPSELGFDLRQVVMRADALRIRQLARLGSILGQRLEQIGTRASVAPKRALAITDVEGRSPGELFQNAQ